MSREEGKGEKQKQQRAQKREAPSTGAREKLPEEGHGGPEEENTREGGGPDGERGIHDGKVSSGS